MIESVDIDPRIKVRTSNDLLLAPRVVRVRSFDEEGVEHFGREVSLGHQTGQTVLPIVIDSFGGDVYALFSMLDILKGCKLTIATVVEGKAMSCGAALFTCGAEGYRFMGPNATLMVHDISWDNGEGKAEEIRVGAKETDRLNKKMWRLMEKNIGQPSGYLSRMVQERGRTDWYMTAKEALRHNIANHLRVPSLRTTVRVETVLE